MRKMTVLAVLVAVILGVTGCLSGNNFSLLPEQDDTLSTRLVKAPINSGTKDRILVLDIEGVITEVGNQGWFSVNEPTTAIVRRKLEKAERDQRIKAVVLRINSPGGTVTGSDIVYREITRYREKTKVPVVAAFMGVAASGGYYVACASDTIVAHPTTITGSLGVIMHWFGFSGLFEKIGMESRVIKAGALKDVGNPFDEFTDEERAVMQRLVDDAYDRFVTVIDNGRPGLTREEVLKLADGRVYTAVDAKHAGLVDQLGDLEDAIDEAKRLAKVRDAGVILYSTSQRPEQNIYSTTRAEAPPLEIDTSMIDYETMLELSRPRMLYMWMGF
jgi:protease IV